MLEVCDASHSLFVMKNRGQECLP